jgi:hypothetical protein
MNCFEIFESIIISILAGIVAGLVSGFIVTKKTAYENNKKFNKNILRIIGNNLYRISCILGFEKEQKLTTENVSKIEELTLNSQNLLIKLNDIKQNDKYPCSQLIMNTNSILLEIEHNIKIKNYVELNDMKLRKKIEWFSHELSFRIEDYIN